MPDSKKRSLKSVAVAVKGWMEEVGDQRRGMVSCKSRRCCTASGRLPNVASLTVLKMN